MPRGSRDWSQEQVLAELLRKTGTQVIREAPSAATPTPRFLQQGSGYAQSHLAAPEAWLRGTSPGGPGDVSALRASLLAGTYPTPAPVTVTGTFLPCLLLFKGWWEQSASAASVALGQGGVQDWLFTGFSQWAPSWDVSTTAVDGPEEPLVGQLGSGDEADSLTVVVMGRHARKLREDIQNYGMLFQASVSGVVHHRSELAPEEVGGLGPLGDTFEYCLKVDDDAPGIERQDTAGGIYSGYLWQCLVPEKLLRTDRPPSLGETFFVWEHTNFLNESALAYNKDSLQHKVAYLTREHGPLRLLQKSSALVDFGGDPLLPIRAFYNWLAAA